MQREPLSYLENMNKSLILLLVVVIAAALAQDSRPSRIFRERVRSQDATAATPPASEEDHHDDEEEDEDHRPVKTNGGVMGSMDTIAALAKVQRDQAESFHLWSSQFNVFKKDVMKFMEQTSDVLQKNDKKIKTLQRVVRKIANDIDE